MSSVKYYTDKELAQAALQSDFQEIVAHVEEGFRAYANRDMIIPEKASQIINAEIQSRVNCMPCTAFSLGYSGVKLVSVFPDNTLQGKPNVSGMILLSSSEDGLPVAVLDAGFVTALRTALVGGIAARFLAIDRPLTIGILGAGEEAFMHFFVMAKLFPSLIDCKIASRRAVSEDRFAKSAKKLFSQMNIKCCNSSYEKAACGADIIVTAISGQSPILKANWVKPGAFYCHVGGIEDEYAVALKADKIVCDSWEALKHRGSPTISHMYHDGLLSDDDIYGELHELVIGEKIGRESEQEINYFNSIGMAFTDIYLSAFLIKQCDHFGFGQKLQNDHFSIFELDTLE